MEGIKKVLIAVDFSDYSLMTIRAGLGLAQDSGAEAVLVNVINERDLASLRAARVYTQMVNEEKYIQEQTEYRMKRFSELVEEASCGDIEPQVEVRLGHPATEIIQAIDDLGADIVVIGTKGRTNIANMIFGSVAEKVYRRAPVTVLSVRGDSHAELVCRLKA